MSLAAVQRMPVQELEELAAKPSTSDGNGDRRQKLPSALGCMCALSILTLVAILIDGYHPYSEDAGIYVASLRKLAQPSLYPVSGTFLEPYVRLSLFSHFAAWLLRNLPLPIEALLFGLHLATTSLLLYGGYGIAKRSFRTDEGRWGGTFLFALCLSIPVAGTSLSLMDPYLTGRSFSTPFTLLAVCAIFDRSWWRTCLFLALATLFHPLMGGYAIGLSLLLIAVRRRSWPALVTIAVSGILAAAILQSAQGSVTESPAYTAAVSTRTYFFLSEWSWYEILGLIAPLALLVLWGRQRRTPETVFRSLARACVALGLLSCAISLMFCHPTSPLHRVAALQPLRPFLFIYIVMFLFLGGLLAESTSRRTTWRWAVAVLAVGVSIGLAWVQKGTYRGSPQVELPGTASANPWHRAFDWIQVNTAADTMVALDSSYIESDGEDSLGFRAIAMRDSLADRSKDGGAAAVFPQLADRWLREQTVTTNLNRIDDAERRRRLVPFHVSWIVLDGNAATALRCPFATTAVKVCRLQ